MKTELAKEIVFFSKKLKRLGFLSGFSGNISVRTSSNSFMITPSGCDKGELKAKDIIEVSMDGCLISGKGRPSSEWKMHSFIYRNQSQAKAIIHTHPPFISVLSCTKIKVNKPLMAEFLIMLKGLPKTPYFTPGSNEVDKSLEKYLKKSRTLILSNHGLVTYASNLRNAFALTEEAEHFARIYYLSSLIGEIDPIKKDKLSALNKLAENFNF